MQWFKKKYSGPKQRQYIAEKIESIPKAGYNSIGKERSQMYLLLKEITYHSAITTTSDQTCNKLHLYFIYCKLKKKKKLNEWYIFWLFLDELSGQTTLLDKTVYGVENSSTFLECSPKSQRALTYWQYQHSTEDHKQEVGTTSAAHTSSILLK